VYQKPFLVSIKNKKLSPKGESQFADKVCKLKQTERNEVIFHEKRASAYKGKVVEFFVKTLEITIDNYYSL